VYYILIVFEPRTRGYGFRTSHERPHTNCSRYTLKLFQSRSWKTMVDIAHRIWHILRVINIQPIINSIYPTLDVYYDNILTYCSDDIFLETIVENTSSAEKTTKQINFSNLKTNCAIHNIIYIYIYGLLIHKIQSSGGW